MSFDLISKIFSYLTVCLSLFYFAALQQTYTPVPLSWDEVDYVNAAREGIAGNALDTKSLSFPQFVRLSLAKAKKTPPETMGFPEESEDTFLLRHFHPVLPVYFWSFFTAETTSIEQYRMRLSSIVLVLLFVTVFIFTCRAVLPVSYRPSIEAAAFFTTIFICSPLFFESFSWLHYHNFFLTAFILYCGLLVRFLLQSDRINAALFGFGTAILALSLETWIFPFSVSLPFLVYQIYRRKISLKILLIACVSFFVSTLVLFPAFWLTLYPLKSWSFYAYRIFFESSKEYGNVSSATIWQNLIFQNWLLWLAITISAIIGVRFLIKDKSAWIIFILGAAYSLLLTPVAINMTYLLPGIAVLMLFSTISLGSFFGERQKLRIALPILGLMIVAAAVFQTPFQELRRNGASSLNNFNSDLAQIENLIADENSVLIQGGHIIRYYLPDTKKHLIKDLTLCPGDKLGFCRRENYQYVSQSNLLENGEYKAVVISKTLSGNKIPPEKLSEIEKAGFLVRELNDYRCYLVKNSSDNQQ